MRAAKERKRLAEPASNWKRVATLLVTVDAAPDGRTVAIRVNGRRAWSRCGSERAVRGALAKLLYGTRRRA